MPRWDAQRLVSAGVGTAALEYLLKIKAPDLGLRCGDYAAGALARLREWFGDTVLVCILIPCGLMTAVALMREAKTILSALLPNQKKLAPAGYLRTSSRRRQLFEGVYVQTGILTADLPVWGLTIVAHG